MLFVQPNRVAGECVSSLLSLSLKGMGIIEQLDPTSFTNYLKKYRNTICGRHPIGVLLNVSAITQQPHQVLVPLLYSARLPHQTPKQLVLKTRCCVQSSLLQQMMMTVSHKRNVLTGPGIFCGSHCGDSLFG